MTREQAAIMLGKSRTFFSSLQLTNIAKYNFIMSMKGTTLVEQYRAYNNLVVAVVKEYADLPYLLEDAGIPISRFSEYLADKGVYKHHNSYSVASYAGTYNTTYSGFLKKKKVIESFKEFIKEYSD